MEARVRERHRRARVSARKRSSGGSTLPQPSSLAPRPLLQPTWPTSTRVTPPDTPGSTSRICGKRGTGVVQPGHCSCSYQAHLGHRSWHACECRQPRPAGIGVPARAAARAHPLVHRRRVLHLHEALVDRAGHHLAAGSRQQAAGCEWAWPGGGSAWEPASPEASRPNTALTAASLACPARLCIQLLLPRVQKPGEALLQVTHIPRGRGGRRKNVLPGLTWTRNV